MFNDYWLLKKGTSIDSTANPIVKFLFSGFSL